MPRAGELSVRLKQSKGVRGDEAFGFGKADLFCNLSLGGEKRTSKVVKDGGADTAWDEEFCFKIAAYVNLALYQSLKIFIYDKDCTGDSRRGTCKIDVKSLLEEHEDEVPDQEYPVVWHGEERGHLMVGFSFKPAVVVPAVKPELDTVKSQKKEEESAFDHLVHKIQSLGHHHHRKPKKPSVSSSSSSVPTEHAVVGLKKKDKVHAEEKKEEQEEAEDEEKHEGWTSESESEHDSEYESESSGDE